MSAEVLHNYVFSPELKFNYRGVYTPFWTGSLNECPALTLPEVEEVRVTERLPWSEIKKLYPNQGIGMINVIYRNQETMINPLSGCVLITKANWSKLQVHDACGYVTMEITGENNICRSGELSITHSGGFV